MTEQQTGQQTGQTLVVIGGGRWGKGTTLAEAKRNFTRYGGALSGGYAVLTFGARSEFDGVDDMGRVHWRGEEPAERLVEARGRR